MTEQTPVTEHPTSTTPAARRAAAPAQTERGWMPAGAVGAVVTLVALVVFSALLGGLGADGGRWLVWLGTMLAPAIAVWPLAVRLFRGIAAVAFPFALALGGLLVAFASWTLAYLQLLPFASWSAWLLVAALAVACWAPPGLRQGAVSAVRERATRSGLGFFLAVFVVALGTWAYVRGTMPQIDGLEKFMDYGFMMSIGRTDFLPAADMWFAGQDINYYYFGQFFYALLCALAFTSAAVGYNLAMASTFAFMVTLAAAIGWQLNALRRARRGAAGGSSAGDGVAGVLTAFFVAIAGNSHAFFFAPGAPGRPLIEWLNGVGIAGASLEGWFYPHSTRFIGYNPVTTDKTIHEFPFYSFLVGDLHAHLVNTAFVLLFVGLVVQRVAGGARDAAPAAVPASIGFSWAEAVHRLSGASRRFLLDPIPLVGAVLLAVFLMGNYWDFVIYYTVLLVAALVAGLLVAPRSGLLSVGVLVIQQACVLVPYLLFESPLAATVGGLVGAALAGLALALREDRLTRSGFELAALVALAQVLSLPFALAFEPISRSIGFAQQHTPFWQLAVLWGPQVLILAGGLAGLILVRRGAGGLTRIDAVVVALGISAVGLILVPEVVYVVDIYENGFARANTMFKLTYQASILLGIVMPFAVIGAWRAVRQGMRRRQAGDATGRAPLIASWVALVAGAGLLVLPAWYPFAAFPQAAPGATAQNYVGLDGAAWMAAAPPGTATIGDAAYTESIADDAAAIAWLNENVDGQPAIVEAAGISYTHLGRISAYTGLPTVIGWESHEWLWRTSADEPDAYSALVAPRIGEVQQFYENTAATADAFIDKYDIEYVIVGEWEMSRYPTLDAALLESLGEVVFEQGNTTVIRVD
ncbi:DUF2298 domain-containing protein [Microbacterium hominis]|uniref:Chlor_Arch_YYY domain-containing protein n=1 Tax=Microbacterium hominis TaxID=162426 RepID=A0A7D4UIQ0_9MICO|nr:DUF2298 domain-containing protein [Microbacterium hominis]QKJ18707.1 hypothetical protein HQM25_04445 [Microbacterium hominis]